MKRIVFITDTHFWDFERTESLETVKKVSREADAIIHGGDWGVLPSDEEWEELFGSTPVFTIGGNHDNVDVLRTYERKGLLTLIPEGRTIDVCGLRVTGIWGSVLYNPIKTRMLEFNPYEFVERVSNSLKSLSRNIDKPDITVSHEVPLIVDETADFIRTVRGIIDIFIALTSPVVHFFGHWHVEEPIASFLKNYEGKMSMVATATTIYGNYAVVTVKNGEIIDIGFSVLRD